MASAIFLLALITMVAATPQLSASTIRADAATSRPSLPCIPGRRWPPWLPPCSPPPPPPAECYTSVSGLMPCADFLTNVEVRAPAGACCDGFRSIVSGAPICLCHVVNGDFNKLLPAPMLRLRMVQLPLMCRVPFPRATLRQCTGKPYDLHRARAFL
ncbi:hypothetical protein C2845_PM16G18190 [Panicum miliaceum]|uniref:Bifunctional inhibitor/plant lipid transfer protein/seed storage helical domain-containing protein n=1 Tax=Panicum miliaceum TaxID=4540 RepID=A0A3L6Q0Q4_PANMI|nr:hypothetical protein C2845_PM16G18190 [Panicum miliaceum]